MIPNPNFEALNQADALNLEAFLNSQSGQIVLRRLRADRPNLAGGIMETVALNAKRAEGWEDCINQMLLLAEARPQPEVEQQPFLSDVDTPRT